MVGFEEKVNRNEIQFRIFMTSPPPEWRSFLAVACSTESNGYSRGKVCFYRMNLNVGKDRVARIMRGRGWDLSGAVYEAMRFIGKFKAGGKSLERLFFQTTLGTTDTFQDNAVVQALARLR